MLSKTYICISTGHNCAALVAALVAVCIGHVLDLAGGDLRQSAHQLGHRVARDVHAVVLPALHLRDLQLGQRLLLLRGGLTKSHDVSAGAKNGGEWTKAANFEVHVS